MASPILKWVGGKRGLVPELLKHVPDDFNDYYEPFCGGAALFFALDAEPGAFLHLNDHLNDSNPHLINVYTQVRDNVEEVIDRLKLADSIAFAPGADFRANYMAVRGLFNDERVVEPSHRAAYFIAINRWGFNGLWRVNKKGECNVPPGRFFDARRRVPQTPPLMNHAKTLRAASAALKGVEITCGDFAQAVKGAKAGDLVYFDPPYIPVTTTADFTSYTAEGFDGDAQKRLLVEADILTHRGVHVIISNSDTPHTRKLLEYIPGRADFWQLHEVQARRAVNCNAKKRGKVGELIIVGRSS